MVLSLQVIKGNLPGEEMVFAGSPNRAHKDSQPGCDVSFFRQTLRAEAELLCAGQDLTAGLEPTALEMSNTHKMKPF